VQVTRDAWQAWFQAWFAAHWIPADLPGLRVLVLLYNAVQTGERQRAAEVRMTMKAYGMTPEGQAALRWKTPEEPVGASKAAGTTRYGHLQAVDG
jgi:transglutaminase-like putative cysteine protease